MWPKQSRVEQKFGQKIETRLELSAQDLSSRAGLIFHFSLHNCLNRQKSTATIRQLYLYIFIIHFVFFFLTSWLGSAPARANSPKMRLGPSLGLVLQATSLIGSRSSRATGRPNRQVKFTSLTFFTMVIQENPPKG